MRNKFAELALVKFKQTGNLISMLKSCYHDYDCLNQNPYHLENDVYTHTMMVFSEALKCEKLSRSGLMAALFHDTGKSFTRQSEIETKKVSFYGHENVSMFIFLDFIKKHFNDLEFTEKEIIKTLQLINWHQINLNGFDPSFYRNFIKRFYSPNKEVYNRFIRDWVNVRICDYAGRIHFDERKTSSVHDFMDFVESPETQEFLNQPLNELEIFDKELIILSGISYSGKSTIANKIQSSYGHVIVSSDDELIRLATGMPYNEAFSKLETNSSFKNKHRVNLENSFYNAMKENKNIIIDQTNLTKKSRRWKIHEAKKRGYKVKSIVVLTTSPMVETRQHDRSNKYISSAVLGNQRRIFSLPSYDEGFDEIEFNFDSF